MKLLSRSDEILLLAIYRLSANAYGVTIAKEVAKKTSKKIALGPLWVQLDNLCRKGYISKTMAGSTPERGGRGKIYYNLTPYGFDALEKVRKMQAELWEGIPQVLPGKGLS